MRNTYLDEVSFIMRSTSIECGDKNKEHMEREREERERIENERIEREATTTIEK
jgi:hypothetical protein